MQITAFLSIGSTYTFLTALRLRGVIEREGLDLRFRPFSVRAIMREMNNIPFPPEKEAKVRYMWRDIERRAEGYGLPTPTVPAPYPLQDFDRANQVGVIAEQEGWYLDYFEAAYRAWFLDGVEAGSDDNILLKPPRRMSLEEALEYIESDELVEITPDEIRLRKAMLNENDRKRFARAAALR